MTEEAILEEKMQKKNSLVSWFVKVEPKKEKQKNDKFKTTVISSDDEVLSDDLPAPFCAPSASKTNVESEDKEKTSSKENTTKIEHVTQSPSSTSLQSTVTHSPRNRTGYKDLSLCNNSKTDASKSHTDQQTVLPFKSSQKVYDRRKISKQECITQGKHSKQSPVISLKIPKQEPLTSWKSARRKKDSADAVVRHLSPYYKQELITSKELFKDFARRLTHLLSDSCSSISTEKGRLCFSKTSLHIKILILPLVWFERGYLVVDMH